MILCYRNDMKDTEGTDLGAGVGDDDLPCGGVEGEEGDVSPFSHQLHDGTVYDEETDTWIEGTAFATFQVVDGVEYGICTTTGIEPPAGMTWETWLAHRRHLNEIALTNRIRELRQAQ